MSDNTVLCAWIGQTDLDAAAGNPKAGPGPIGRALQERGYRNILLLSNYKKPRVEEYTAWLSSRFQVDLTVEYQYLSHPMDFTGIYFSVIASLDRLKAAREGEDLHFAFHVSPGTSAMAAVWILLAKTLYAATAELIISSPENGVQTLSIPINLAYDFILPDRGFERAFRSLAAGEKPPAPEFDEIIGECLAMQLAKREAQQYALFDVPVLILGESGTGKELFAAAIRKVSSRKDKPYITVNCGAISASLLESELFGYKKGAFTDAKQAKKGYFAQADGGTLFLDEIGDLPPEAQVKLLRVLQEGEIQPLGAEQTEKVDVRIIAATNRNLQEMVSSGDFREDLFHRIAIGVISLPPLREREGDLFLIADKVMRDINDTLSAGSAWQGKSLSARAKAELKKHNWPGNVRELQNVLTRAAIFCTSPYITDEHISRAYIKFSREDDPENILERPLGEGFNLNEVIDEVKEYYLRRAMEESGGVASRGYKLLGFNSYQTYTNWLKKMKLE